jgi:hypothetical protein
VSAHTWEVQLKSTGQVIGRAKSQQEAETLLQDLAKERTWQDVKRGLKSWPEPGPDPTKPWWENPTLQQDETPSGEDRRPVMAPPIEEGIPTVDPDSVQSERDRYTGRRPSLGQIEKAEEAVKAGLEIAFHTPKPAPEQLTSLFDAYIGLVKPVIAKGQLAATLMDGIRAAKTPRAPGAPVNRTDAPAWMTFHRAPARPEGMPKDPWKNVEEIGTKLHRGPNVTAG